MRKQFVQIVNRAWQLVVKTPEAWDAIAAEQPTESGLRRGYVFPLIGINVLAVFVCRLFYATKNIWQSAFINSIVSAAALTGGYFIACAACFWYINRKYPQRYTRTACTKVVSYCYTIVFLLKLLTTLFPSLFFMKILNIFTGYLVWEACRSIFGIPDEDRSNVVLVFTAIILCVTPALGKLIWLLLPNAVV